MRVAVIGAGVAGLACARALVKAGHSVVVFEKSRGCGGRAATRRLGAFTFDQGATSIAPRGKAIERVMREEISTEGLVQVQKPIWTHGFGRIEPGDSMKTLVARYCYEGGINTLGKRLGEGLDVRLETRIEGLEVAGDGGVAIGGEVFDRAVVAIPLPQAKVLLDASGVARPLGPSVYRPCLSVMLGFAEAFDAPYHALIEPEQRHPLTWVSFEHLKVPGGFRAPEGQSALVAQLSPNYSRSKYEAEEGAIVEDTLDYLNQVLPKRFGAPVESQVMRWRYSQPEATLSFESLNPDGTAIVVTGDGTIGGRIEMAFEAGLKAAEFVMTHPPVQ